MSSTTIDKAGLGDLQALLEGRRPYVAPPEEEPEVELTSEDLMAAHAAMTKMAELNMQQALAALKFLSQYNEDLVRPMGQLRKAINSLAPVIADAPEAVQSIAPEVETPPETVPSINGADVPKRSLKERILEAEHKRKTRPGILKHTEDASEEKQVSDAYDSVVHAHGGSNNSVHNEVLPPTNDLHDAPDHVPLDIYDPASGEVAPSVLSADSGIAPSLPETPYPESLDDLGISSVTVDEEAHNPLA
jgi:hypothetical protein